MKKNIGIGIIGWGYMGRMHAAGLVNIPLFYDDLPFAPVLSAVCSGRLENAQKAREALGFGFATDDYRALLARRDVDAVCICTPNALHERMLLDAFDAGKHVYVEKPLTVDAQSAKRILEAYKGRDLRAQIVFNTRFLPATLRAAQLADEGRIGRVLTFRASYLHSGSVDPDRPVNWKSGADQGGVLLDMGTHALDLLRRLCGDFESIYSKTVTLYPSRPLKGGGVIEHTAEDAVMMVVTLKNGAVGTVEASKIATGANDSLRMEIHGDKGALLFDSQDPNWLYFFDNTVPEAPLGGSRGYTRIECLGRYEKPGGSFPAPKNAVSFTRGHVHSLYSFLNCVHTGQDCKPSLEDGAYIQYAAQAAALSAKTGKAEKVIVL